MDLHAKCHVTDTGPTYSISDGVGQRIEGIPPADYRRFIDDARSGNYNPGVLFAEARHRHAAAVKADQLALL